MRWLVGALLTAAVGCAARPAEPGLAPADVGEQLGQARCGVTQSAAKPLVVEWPAAERGALEARASRGLVAVRYEGCEMEVLSHCEVPGQYEYVGLTAKRESVRIRNVDELYARLPLGAAALEAQLERAGELRVDLQVVGRKESSTYEVSRHDLRGRCEHATHFVSGLTVGAFAMVAGEARGASGGVTVANAGVGAGHTSTREVLREDGAPDACAAAKADDQAPLAGCSALLRVEVLPLSEEPLARPHEPIEPSPPAPEPTVLSTTTPAGPELDPSPSGLELDPTAMPTIDPATLGALVPSPAPATEGTVCAGIDLQLLEIRRKRANPPFRNQAMDALRLRVVNDNDVEVEVDGDGTASFLDADRAVMPAMLQQAWFHPLALPPHSSKVVEVLLPRRQGPRLRSIETQANPTADYWAKCKVVARIDAPS